MEWIGVAGCIVGVMVLLVLAHWIARVRGAPVDVVRLIMRWPRVGQ